MCDEESINKMSGLGWWTKLRVPIENTCDEKEINKLTIEAL
jgi:hypothetical protein